MKHKGMKRILGIILSAMMVCGSAFSLNLQASAANEEQTSVSTVEPTLSDNEEVYSEETADENAEKKLSVPLTGTTYYNEDIDIPTEIVPEVGKVKSVTKTSFLSDRVTLTWGKLDGVSGYSVYYCNVDKSTSYTKFADVTANSVTVTGLLPGTKYYFKITPYLKYNGSVYEGESTIKKTATQPGKVKDLALNRSSSVIELKWSKMPLMTGYKIYRSSASTNWTYKHYKTITSNTNIFTDKNVAEGNQYRYKVVAYRVLYNDCYYHSVEGAYKITFAGLGAPTVNFKTQLRRASLTWKKNKYAQGYDIYYSTKPTGKFTKMSSTTNNFYNTNRLTNGKKYYFRVFPYVIRKISSKDTKILGTYHTYSQTITDKVFGKSVGKTYVEINIRQQHMWYIKDHKIICETDVVTGNDDGYHNTPTGIYKIFQKARNTNLVGADYVSFVNYWLGFTYSGIGIHDASWRSAKEYGKTTYKGNGSHGCVNTPYSAVKKIYNNISKGTCVVVY